MVRRDTSESIIDRKEKYIDFTTSLDWINLNMLRWGFRLPKIGPSIGYNLLFNFLLDFYLSLNLHFPSEEFDFEMPDFVISFPKIEKARYGISRYNKSIYDPPDITAKDLARFLWNVRYHTTEKSTPVWKGKGLALKNKIEVLKEILKNKNIADYYIDEMINSLITAEGKVLNASYVGFAIVGVSRVMSKVRNKTGVMGGYKFRDTEDFKTEKDWATMFPYETQVGMARVNYARVMPKPEKFKETHLKRLSKDLVERVREFKKRSAKTPITKGLDVEVRPEVREITKLITPPKHMLYQRVFFYQKREKMKWEGGKHQARLQNIIEHVKPILDKYGVHGNFRLSYITFAKEYVYMHYKPHRRHKQWKRILTEDDLILKYKRMGCNEQILREIISTVNAFKTVVDLESAQK